MATLEKFADVAPMERKVMGTYTPVHLWNEQLVPWTTACGLRFHNDDGTMNKISATNRIEYADCKECLAELAAVE